MKKLLSLFCGIVFASLSLLPNLATASVIINGTRVIYPSQAKEVTVKLDNVGVSPVLIQSWIDDGNIDAKPENINVPFILTPPINRVEPQKSQTLRLSYIGANLPTDKESIYWLNVLEIPAKNIKQGGENYLKMAFRSRIKLFFRPEGLPGNANDAVKELSWSNIPGGVKVSNPTPYYLSLVTLRANGKEVEGQMVAPKSTQEIKGINVTSGTKINVEFVNDYGALNVFETSVR